MNQKVMPLMIGLLVVAAFLAGRVATKPTKVDDQSGSQPVAQAPAQEEEQPAVLGASDQEALTAGATLTKGNPEAPVTIVEFSDYQCPYCARYSTTTLRQIMDTYGDDIYYVWRDYPLGFHPNAVPAALAARCAGQQGKYWEMHDQLFVNQGDWSEQENAREFFVGLASELDLDTDQLSQCLDERLGKTEIEADLKLAREMGVRATPTFFVNGQKLEGAQPFEQFQVVIEAAINQE